MERAGDILEAFLRVHGIKEGNAYVRFFRSWERIVGTDLAAHSHPVDIRNDALLVEVDHPGWLQMLHMKKDQTLQRVQQEFGELGIGTLHLRLASSEETQEKQDAGRAGRSRRSEPAAGSIPVEPEDAVSGGREQPPAEPSADKNEALSRIEDEELKQTLERLYEDLEQREQE